MVTGMDKFLSGRRVLVVEDEMMVLMMIEDMLTDLGCESVTAAATSDEAIAVINAQIFDAAMLDMNLKGIRNNLIADALTARGVPFIFSTGYDGQDRTDGYHDRPLLKKPFHLEELAAIFSHLLSS